MTKIIWDKTGERLYETGVDHGVLYPIANDGSYETGVPWNGLTTVNETPSGAEATAIYADNIKYLSLISAEEFGATIEAFTYPVEFERSDGSATLVAGVTVGQQNRRPFGFSYRTLLGNDILGTDFGYKIHLVYNALAAPSERSRATINESPEATAMSWSVTTTPIAVTGLKPAARLTIDSTEITPEALQQIEDILYGTESSEPRMLLPDEIVAIVEGTLEEATPDEPAFNSATNVITIPATPNVQYRINGTVVPAGPRPAITQDTTVTANPAPGFVFPEGTTASWSFEYTP